MTELFSPLTLGRATLANRLAVAPMTTSQSHADGTVSDAEMAWLERVAEDGYGMVITCAAAISRTSIAFERQMSLGDDRFLPGLQVLAERLRRHRTVAIAQLCHGGSRAIPALAGQPSFSASAFTVPGLPSAGRPRPLSPGQIEQIVEDFAEASERAAKAGFDGVEFHGANGYLFGQFISTMSNQRGDKYGGSLENRARFSREVVRACRACVPAGFILGFRLSFESNPFDNGLDIDENIQIMRWLAEDGIDYGHVSHMDLAAKSVKYPEEIALAYIRARIDRSLPLVVAGGVMSRAQADRALELGADVVAVGRGAIGNVEVPTRLARSEALTQMPYDAAQLSALSVSDDFVRYLTTAIPVSRLGLVR